jgi:hypothetical protein
MMWKHFVCHKGVLPKGILWHSFEGSVKRDRRVEFEMLCPCFYVRGRKLVAWVCMFAILCGISALSLYLYSALSNCPTL